MRQHVGLGWASLLAVVLLAGCMGPRGDTFAEKRQAVQQMRTDTLEHLYRIHPAARDKIRRSAGYGVFSNVGTNLFLLSTGSGWGLVRNNRSGAETYMKMFSAGVGIGLGVKDFRGIFVFANEQVLSEFVNSGWEASGQADAAAKAGEKGGAAAGAITVAPGVELYQITENGLALQATIQGTKYWKDDDLNASAKR